MLQTLSEFWPERQHALSERIDLLINNLKEEQQARGSSDLNSAHASDEIRNTSTVLMATMAALGLNSADEDPLHKKLEILLRHYRDILAQLRDHHQDSKKHYDLFRQSLKTAAAGEWDKGKGEGLVKDERRIVDAVASLLKDVEDLENDPRQPARRTGADAGRKSPLGKRYQRARPTFSAIRIWCERRERGRALRALSANHGSWRPGQRRDRFNRARAIFGTCIRAQQRATATHS